MNNGSEPDLGQPVRIIVAFSGGGGIDSTARLAAQWLQERIGQRFVIDNQPGDGGNASTNAATETVVRAPADGYTLLLVTAINAISETLYDGLPFDFMEGIAPVAAICRQSNVLVINPTLPVRTIPEFIAFAKARPGQLRMALSGVGRPSHLAGELFNKMAGLTMSPLVYRGPAPALNALAAGDVDVMFPLTAEALAHIMDGSVCPLGVTTATRSRALPDVPALGDFVSGYEASPFFGIGAPKHTPRPVIEKLNKAINGALAEPKAAELLARFGGIPIMGSPDDFGELLRAEIRKWGNAVKAARMKSS